MWKVIYFYPKDFTFVCPTEINEFSSLNGFQDERVIAWHGEAEELEDL